MNHLKELAKTSRRTSKAAQLEERMGDVDAALNAGASRAQVLDALAKDGLVMTMDYFDITRRRIKAKLRDKRAGGHNSQNTVTATSAPQESSGLPLQPTFVEQKEAPFKSENIDNKNVSPHTPHDPRALKAIFAQKVDLDGYAKFAKKGKA